MKRQLKKLLFLAMFVAVVLGIIMTTPTTAQAAVQGECGEHVTWTLDEEGTLTISGTGDMYDYGSAPWKENRASINAVVIEDGVTSIGDRAFYSCESLTSVTIPDSVTAIGDSAFYYCKSLTSVTLPNSVTSIGEDAFYYCESLTSVTIPDGVTTIGVTAFAYCYNLASVTIPDSVTAIGDSAFFRCYNLTTVTIPDSVTTIRYGTFMQCALTSVTIPNSVTSIGGCAFYGCSRLTSVTIPNSVTSIGDSAFEVCTSLTDVYYDGLQEQWETITIGSDNENLVYTTLHTLDPAVNGINIQMLPAKTIYEGFVDLDLTGLTLTATYIDGSTGTITRGFTISGFDSNTAGTKTITVTYKGCTATFDVALVPGTCGDNVTWMLDGEGTLTISGTGHIKNGGDWKWEGYSVKAVVIEDGVTGIGNYAFDGCYSLTSVTIPYSVTNIGSYVFPESGVRNGIWVDDNNANYCSDDKGVLFNKDKTELIRAPGALSDSYIVPSGVTKIGKYAFSGCNLTSVMIPGSVTDFGSYAFNNCDNLTSATILDGVTGIGTMAFYGCFDLTAVTLPNSVTTIGSGAFYYCESLTSITIPDSVTSIGEYAFFDCSSLTSITIPDGVTSICGNTFKSCYNLASVTIPDSVTSIGEFAFNYCKSLTSIMIPVSVTSIEYAAFEECSSLTDVYYEGTLEQWNAIVIGGGNGCLTDATLHALSSALQFSGASLSLQNNLAVNYKVDKALLEQYGFTDPYVIVQMNGKQTKLTQYKVDGDKYVFSFRNIAPDQMGDTITATLFATFNGMEVSGDARDYSVAEYCYNMLEEYAADEYAEFRTLLVDLLHYGAASQNYTGYKTDSLVNAALTAEQQDWGTSSEPELNTVLNKAYQTVENPTATWKGAGLYLQNAVSMRLKFTAESIDGLNVRIESGDNTWTIASDKFVEEDGVYYVYFTGLDAGQMRQKVYLTICNGDTPVSNTACYSIESYVYEKQNSTIAGLSELVMAMMKYGDSACAYAN